MVLRTYKIMFMELRKRPRRIPAKHEIALSQLCNCSVGIITVFFLPVQARLPHVNHFFTPRTQGRPLVRVSVRRSGSEGDGSSATHTHVHVTCPPPPG